jgi:hypothetical protein
MRTLIRGCWLGALAMLIIGCAAQSGGGGASLKAGMTTDQAVEAMGQPDLKDNIPAANHNGPDLLRYTWLNAGEAAVFGPDMKVASIVNVGPTPSTLQEEAQRQQEVQRPFDPIQTPFDYVFYPFKAAMVFIGAGLNCLGGNGCHTPPLPPVVAG